MLRDEIIEAMAKAYFYEVGRRSGSTLEFETAYDSEQADFKYVAGLALDAGLDALERHGHEWSESAREYDTISAAGNVTDLGYVFRLTAALRPPVSSSQENPE